MRKKTAIVERKSGEMYAYIQMKGRTAHTRVWAVWGRIVNEKKIDEMSIENKWITSECMYLNV